MNKEIKILVADDHPIFREGLVKIIEMEVKFKVCSSISNGNDAFNLIKTKKPDIAILDISMPGLNGIEIAGLIQDEELKTKPIILTMYNDEEYLESALEHGVTGYLLKDSTLNEIIDCIKIVSTGGYYISKELQSYLSQGKKNKDIKNFKEKLNTLTNAEKQILKLLSQNKTSLQIASELFISFRTVQNHRMNITHKLGISGHNGLLFFAIENKNLF
jgi:DNA-binding NarL/FixJ family response regulator